MNDPLIHLLKLVVAAAIGTMISEVHKFGKRPRGLGKTAQQAEILICVAGALMMVVISDSLPRALGIAGGASLIRFRTQVKDTRDAIIYLLLLGLGMACGLGHFAIAALSAAFLAVFLAGLNYVGEDRPRPMMVEVESDNSEFSPDSLERIFAYSNVSFESRGFKRGETTSVRYQVNLPPSTSVSDVTQTLMTSGLPLKAVVWDSKAK
jgi:uncharacterized membrane protein YhiD involved in acid resistance